MGGFVKKRVIFFLQLVVNDNFFLSFCREVVWSVRSSSVQVFKDVSSLSLARKRDAVRFAKVCGAFKYKSMNTFFMNLAFCQ